ncbi:MAG: Ig-like domain-containing protein, partial [Bacillota bacterium]|nr:Ig-like domain-containing protein [Bacillota bacterium]
MKKFLKSAISLILVSSMLFGLMPLSVFAHNPLGSFMSEAASVPSEQKAEQPAEETPAVLSEPDAALETAQSIIDEPDIVVTEVLQDCADADYYEAVEIYNTSDKTLDLKDYALGYKVDTVAVDETALASPALVGPSSTYINAITKYYRYGVPGDESTVSSLPFPAHSSMVLWIKNLNSTYTQTIDQFISTNKIDSADQVLIAGEGKQVSGADVGKMTNGTASGFYLPQHSKQRVSLFVIKKATRTDDFQTMVDAADKTSIVKPGNEVISTARYNFITAEFPAGNSIKFHWDDTNKIMRPYPDMKGSSTTAHTLGKMECWQKPQISGDIINPTITNTTLQEGDVAAPFISAELTDDTDLRTATVYYRGRSWTDTSYKKITKDFVFESGRYLNDVKSKSIKADIDSKEVMGSDYIDYYIETTDGAGNTATLGTAGSPLSIDLRESYEHIDTVPPTVQVIAPAADAQFKWKFDGTITATYSDNKTIDTSSVKVVVDGTEYDVPGATASGFTYSLADNPITTLGTHTIAVKVKDEARPVQNETTESVNIVIGADKGVMQNSSSDLFVKTGSDMNVISDVYSDTQIQSVRLYYKKAGDTQFNVMDMAAGASESAGGNLTKTKYSATIPSVFYGNARKVDYYVEAVSGSTLRYPESGTTFVNASDQPEILITEVLQDNKGADYYESVEMYNNTDRTIDLKDYAIGFKTDAKPASEEALAASSYTSPSSTYVNFITKYFVNGAAGDESKVKSLPFPAKSTMVLWIKNANPAYSQTISDYLSQNPNVSEDQLLFAGQDNTMTNGTPSGFYLPQYAGSRCSMFVIKLGYRTNKHADVIDAVVKQTVVKPEHSVVCTARYLYATADFAEDKSIKFKWDGAKGIMRPYPSMDGANTTVHNIGYIQQYQKPPYTDDATPPVVTSTPLSETAPGAVTLAAQVTDTNDIRTGRIFYRLEGDSNWTVTEHNFVEEDSRDKTDITLSQMIPANKVGGSAYIEYYFEAVDGNGNSATCGTAKEPYKVVIGDHIPPTITITSPEKGQSFDGCYTGTLKAVLSDNMAINRLNAAVKVDGKSYIVPFLNITETSLEFSFADKPLPIGKHTITVEVTDTSVTPNTGSASVEINVVKPTSKQIIHTPVSELGYGKSLLLTATVVDGGAVPTVQYKKKNTA